MALVPDPQPANRARLGLGRPRRRLRVGPEPLATLCVLAATFIAGEARADGTEESRPGGTAEAQPTRREIEAWLESRALPADIGADDTPEAPPPPPRKPGWVLEGAAGTLGHAGSLRRVSPVAPWFHLKFGWEPAQWVMLFVQGDTAFGSTSLANPPPPPRGYALWSIGAGVRATWDPWEALGLFIQGAGGAGRVSDDVLGTYGFTDADKLGAYFGAMGGFKWYPINPHYAIVGSGGVRLYPGVLARRLSNATPLAWLGSVGLAYTFF